MSGFLQKYKESKNKKPFEILIETRREIYNMYMERQEQEKKKKQEEKDIKRIGAEIAKEVEKLHKKKKKTVKISTVFFLAPPGMKNIFFI